MTNLKSKLAALLLALTITGSAGASVYATTPGAISGSGYFGNTLLPAGSFDDFIQFTVGIPNSGATWAALSVNFGSLFGISALNSDLFAGTLSSVSGSPLVTGTASSGLLEGTGSPFFTTATAGTSGQLAGAYTLHVYGTVALQGGSYGGTIALAPVPEPGEWALMLSGIGLIGFMLRRRTSDVA